MLQTDLYRVILERVGFFLPKKRPPKTTTSKGSKTNQKNYLPYNQSREGDYSIMLIYKMKTLSLPCQLQPYHQSSSHYPSTFAMQPEHSFLG